VSLFEDTFPLEKSLKWTMIKDKDTNDEYYGIKSITGEDVLPCSLFSLAYFNEQTAIVSDKDNYFWLLDKKGGKVNKEGFDWLTPANQKLAIFQKDGNFGLITQEGKVLLDKKENLLFLDADNAGNVLVREKEGEETKTLDLEAFLKTYVK